VREEFNIEKCLPSGRTQGSRSIPELLRFDWEYAPIAAPYRIYPDLPEEYKLAEHISRDARGATHGSTSRTSRTKPAMRLWERHKSKLAFPAGPREPDEA
jgi:hypothetical protein